MSDIKRNDAVRLTLYNHKGGVGKTTLTTNIASALANKGKRVLLVDSDPQCNLTSYLFEESVVDNLLDESDTDKGRTLWSALKPIADATGSYKYVKPYETLIQNLWLIPGDIQLAEFEVSLNELWRDCLDRRIKGFRGANALSALINECCEKLNINYVFYDTGPNIGSLNRTVLMDCDYFIVPVSCDLFSVRALKSLGHTLVRWVLSWETISQIAPKDIYLMRGKPKFLGYIPQRFKIYGGIKTKIASSYVSKIQKTILSDVVSVLHEADPNLADKSSRGINLGEVKDFSTLVQLSLEEGVPLNQLSKGAADQKLSAESAFNKIADSIINRTEQK